MRQIQIIKVDKNKSPKGYFVTDISYSSEGKTKGLKVFPFGPQEQVAKAFEGAQPGDVFEVEFQKNDRDFWEFKPGSIRKLEAKPAEGATVAQKTQWVPDAERQVMIVRQSSISSAVELLKGTKGASVEEVLKVAKQFEEFVLAKPAPKDIE